MSITSNSWRLAAAAALFTTLHAHAAVVVSGTLTAQAGNNGNPAVQQTVTTAAIGTFNVGPLSGPQFGNNSTQGALIIATQPSPNISAAATGSDTGIYAANGATTFIEATITFDFSVVGPLAGIGVPLLFGGSSNGLVANTGDPNRWNSAVGTRLEITSVGGVYNFKTVTQSGTPADIYSPNVQDVKAAWGRMASGPVNYTSYAASFEYGATVLSGQFNTGAQVLKLATIIQGGTPGIGNPSGLASSGTANSFLDAYIQLDPTWAHDNPGYTLLMDASIGVTPVPEPDSTGLMLAGLMALCGLRRIRRQAA